MNHTPIYITAGSQISMQQPLSDEWLQQPVLHTEEPYVRSVDPDFKAFISAGEARRLGKLLKRALTTALDTLRQAGLERPEAIITGTGLGSVESTEAFLTDLVNQGEQMLKPTHFMQSTHNTIGSLIAIHTATHGYNNTYAHLGLSFESALLDAVLQLRAGHLHNVLVGAHDAITPSYFTLLQHMGYVGQSGQVPCGETAVELLLRTDTDTANAAWCELAGLRLLHHPTPQQVDSAVNALLAEADLTVPEVEALLLGVNGYQPHDEAYRTLLPAWCTEGSRLTLQYKQFFGESFTASALGLYAAASILKSGVVPGAMIIPQTASTQPQAPRTLLMAHVYDGGRDVSLILLRSCGPSSR
jgi:hypothetical protein